MLDPFLLPQLSLPFYFIIIIIIIFKAECNCSALHKLSMEMGVDSFCCDFSGSVTTALYEERNLESVPQKPSHPGLAIWSLTCLLVLAPTDSVTTALA